MRGSCLSPGYWNNKEKTRKAFVQNPLNKFYQETIYRTGDLVHYNERYELVFDGRKDFQIKHMGYRIELGEIETAAMSFPDIPICCCLYDDKEKQIVLFVTGQIDSRKLIKDMKQVIPRYMLPNRIVSIETMPLNQSGKIDRVKLKEML